MDFDEAEASGSFKPAWDAGEADAAADALKPAWETETADTADTTETEVIAPMPAIIINPVIAVGASKAPEAPKSAPPAPTVPTVPVHKAATATVIGMSPAAKAIVDAENARIAAQPSATSTAPMSATRLGGISPEAAAVVAAANAAARAPMPTSEALDSSSFIEAATAATEIQQPKAPAFPPAISPIPNRTPSAPPARPASTFPTADAARAVPLSVAIGDPFKSPRRSTSDDVDDDLPFRKKKTSAAVYGVVGIAILTGIGVVAKLASSPDAPPYKPTTTTTATATATADIPPPEDRPAETAAPAAKPVETVARPAETAPPAAKPVEVTPPPKAAEPPHPHVAAHPAPPPPAPHPVAPPPAAKAPTAAAPPKSPPKPQSGGIVRDSPF